MDPNDIFVLPSPNPPFSKDEEEEVAGLVAEFANHALIEDLREGELWSNQPHLQLMEIMGMFLQLKSGQEAAKEAFARGAEGDEKFTEYWLTLGSITKALDSIYAQMWTALGHVYRFTESMQSKDSELDQLNEILESELKERIKADPEFAETFALIKEQLKLQVDELE